MEVNYYAVIKMQYRLHKLTADQVWNAKDKGMLTEEQANAIAGPKG